jgi:beta-glucosidase
MVPPFFVTGPFRGISDCLGIRGNVTYNQGIARLDILAQQTGLTLAADGDATGVTVETYNNADFSGTPVSTRHEASINAGPYAQLPADSSDAPDMDIRLPVAAMREMMRKSVAATLNAPPQYSRWTAFYRAPSEGKYLVFVEHPGKYRLTIDGASVIDHAGIASAAVSQALIDLKPGAHKVVLDDLGVPPFGNSTLRLGIAKEDTLVHPAAIELAKHADAVVLSVGFDIETEAEGEDREFQLLPGQNELIQQIAAVNPNTIVVLNAGGSVDASSWIDSIAALLHIWYSGEEGGTAMARILFGDADPSGRLPISWERKITDNPSAAFYYPAPGTDRVIYGNDIFVGYRGFEHNHTQPLFPFGFGLSYTMFKYSNLEIHPSPSLHESQESSMDYEVGFDVTNTGQRAGADVAQVYVSEDHPTIARPAQELKGFARVQLDPGQTRHIAIPLDARSFAWYDVGAKAWHADAGTFTVHVGRSSADVQLEGKISLAQPLLVPVE